MGNLWQSKKTVCIFWKSPPGVKIGGETGEGYLMTMVDYSKLSTGRKIEKFLEAIQTAHAGMDPNEFWPATPAQIEAYFDDILALNIFEKFKSNKDKFIKALDSVEPEVLKTFLYSGGSIVGLKVAKKFEGYKLKKTDFIDFVVTILDSIIKRRRQDPFCLGGKNIVLGSKDVDKLLKNRTWVKAKDTELKKAVVGLNVTTESLVWSLFYDIYRSVGMLIHGPYPTSKGILLARDFFDLEPPIWKFSNAYPQLAVYLIYEDTVDIRIDFANHPVYASPIVDKLKFFWIKADRQLKTVKEIEDIDEYYSALRKKQVAHVESLEPVEIIKKGAEIHYYMLKGFFDFYGEDWRPPQIVYDRIDRLGPKYWERYKRPRNYGGGTWARKIYDPRSDFIA